MSYTSSTAVSSVAGSSRGSSTASASSNSLKLEEVLFFIRRFSILFNGQLYRQFRSHLFQCRSSRLLRIRSYSDLIRLFGQFLINLPDPFPTSLRCWLWRDCLFGLLENCLCSLFRDCVCFFLASWLYWYAGSCPCQTPRGLIKYILRSILRQARCELDWMIQQESTP